MDRILTRAFAAVALAAALSVVPQGEAAAQSERWTGAYGGIQAGYAFPSTRDDIGVRQVTPNSFIDNYGSVGPKGLFGGAAIGYGMRAGGAILGLEGDVSFGKISDSTTSTKSGLTVSSKSEVSSVGTLRARIGVPVAASTLVYATGGLAVSRLDYSVAYAGVLNGTLARQDTHTGWVVGAGLEWAIDAKWSFKAEYLYLNRKLCPGPTFCVTSGCGYVSIHERSI